MSSDTPRRCGTIGCGHIALYRATSGVFIFYLCHACALTAMAPPLCATSVEPMTDDEKEK